MRERKRGRGAQTGIHHLRRLEQRNVQMEMGPWRRMAAVRESGGNGRVGSGGYGTPRKNKNQQTERDRSREGERHERLKEKKEKNTLN